VVVDKVWVKDYSAFGVYCYAVMVDGKRYDVFTSTKPVTLSEQIDIAAGYKEGLDVSRPV